MSTRVPTHDRGLQAAFLESAGTPAARTLRTASLMEALRWTQLLQLPAFVVSPAHTGVISQPITCRSADELMSAWRKIRQAAAAQRLDDHVVVQELITGRHYVVDRSAENPAAAVRIWAEAHGPLGHRDRYRLPRTGLLHRSLSLYTARVVTTIGIEDETVLCRIARDPDRGFLLLSAVVLRPGQEDDSAPEHACLGPGRIRLTPDRVVRLKGRRSAK
ncbi:hypothetical protein QFZ82_007592 [Streptomyces sp. V4I23]|uniref:hypothetical protein n=1 Tax=Streptomyces sp. V4I23 TaxID=3042282 RepID=UPI0027814085|nr:hypothetical protein [Streptomyces sp. V4I23]MDQ1013107.1 hypothetical protein [Streptomyces sp. V4I23]